MKPIISIIQANRLLILKVVLGGEPVFMNQVSMTEILTVGEEQRQVYMHENISIR